MICNALDYHNDMRDESEQIGLTVIGDFCQLPPVAEKEEGFAFETKHWKRFEDNTTILTEIKRQTDIEFVEALRHVRRGNGADAVEFFKPYMERLVDVDFDGTTVMAKNIEVDRFNSCQSGRRFPRF